MQEVTLRDFLRNYKSFLPFPKEGLKVVCRDGEDFYVTHHKPETEADKLRTIAQFMVQEMEKTTPLAPPPPAPVVARTPCEASRLMPWEEKCGNEGEHFLVADTSNGEPMGPSDWKPINLCPMHKTITESMGGFLLETP